MYVESTPKQKLPFFSYSLGLKIKHLFLVIDKTQQIEINCYDLFLTERVSYT